MMARYARYGLILFLSSLAFIAVSLPARELAGGRLPLHYPLDAVSLTADQNIVVTGYLDGGSDALLVVRIDDTSSLDYASRYNLEQTIVPGRFELTIQLRGLRTTGGALLNLESLTQLIVFAPDDAANFSEVKIHLSAAPQLPGSAVGYSLGPADAPLFPGFTAVPPESPLIAAGQVVPIQRPGTDPLVTSGFKGIERLVLPWPEGETVDVHLWTEDVGAWEHLPHPLERRIRVNGETALEYRLSFEEWLAERYLRGKRQEASPAGDPWHDIARHRGGHVKVTTTAGPNGIEIALAGDSPDATYLSAVLLAPAGDRAALDFVENQRARLIRASWPVVEPAPLRSADAAVPLSPSHESPEKNSIATASARNGATRLSLDLHSENPVELVAWQITGGPPDLSAYAWAALRTLDRPAANASALQLQQTRLVADPRGLSVTPEQPRRVELWLHPKPDTPAGTYPLYLTVESTSGETRIPITLSIESVDLPAPRAPVGFYLDEAPHLTWSGQDPTRRTKQLRCDLEFMASLGLSALAPGISTPKANDDAEVLAELAMAFNEAPAVMAYTPAKRLIGGSGLAVAAERLAGITRLASQMGLSPIYWSVADEPSNPDQSTADLTALLEVFRRDAPEVKLAAHLNAPQDKALAYLFDLVLINDGYGMSPQNVRNLQRNGQSVWLYNATQPRLTAGVGVLATQADAYVQWHSRMPTADPFDPMDGREGDVMMMLPGHELCPSQPDIHSALLDMAEGVLDQRWILYLARKNQGEETDLTWKIWEKLQQSWQSRLQEDKTDLPFTYKQK